MSINPTLRDSELRYRRLFKAAQNGILILDAETGAITDVNPFLIKMLGYSREVTRERAELICKYASQLHVQFEGQTLEPITLSLGVAIFPEHSTMSAVILKTVDAALYRAKHEGRGLVVIAD